MMAVAENERINKTTHFDLYCFLICFVPPLEIVKPYNVANQNMTKCSVQAK